MRYICQQRQPPGVYYYASMHDEGRGTPVYSGYSLHGGNVNFQQTPGATTTWIRTPGNLFTWARNKQTIKQTKNKRGERGLIPI